MSAASSDASDRVLFVSREQGLAVALVITLRPHRYTVESAAGVRAALGALGLRRFAVVVAELNGVKGGARALRPLRQATAAPLLAFVAASAGGESLRAIDAGADDIVETPYSIGALVARLDALVGRIDPVPRPPSGAGLGSAERTIFEILASSPGRLVTRRRLLRDAWGLDGGRVAQHRLQRTITGLRAKLEVNPSDPRRVLAEPGIGYRLMPTSAGEDGAVGQPGESLDRPGRAAGDGDQRPRAPG